MAYFPINVNMEGVSRLVVTSQQQVYEVVGDARTLVGRLNSMHHSRFAQFRVPDGDDIYLNTDHIVRILDGPMPPLP